MGDPGAMKLLSDQNPSPKLVNLLAAEYPGSIHVRTLGMRASPDPVIWAYAAANDFAIVSKDADFQQRAMMLGHPPKVIWILLGNCPTSTVVSLLRSKHTDIVAFEADPIASLLALS